MLKKTIKYIILFICFFVIGAGLFKILPMCYQYHQSRQEYEKVRESVVQEKEASNKEGDEQQEDPQECPIDVDFDALQRQNPDIIGWIYQEDSPINYPVVKAGDNDTYLHTTSQKTHNFAGSIFMDCRNTDKLTDLCTIIYGHHMRDGSMFASLHRYTEDGYLDGHRYFWYLTKDSVFRLDFYSAVVEEAQSPLYSLFPKEGALIQWARGLQERAEFTNTDIDISKVTKLVALSTCTYEHKNARYVVVLVPHYIGHR